MQNDFMSWITLCGIFFEILNKKLIIRMHRIHLGGEKVRATFSALDTYWVGNEKKE